MIEKIKDEKRFMEIAYIISMAIAFTTRYGDVRIGYKPQIIIGGLWVMLAAVRFVVRKETIETINKKLRFIFAVFMIPAVILHAHTILWMIFGKIEWHYFTTNLTTYIPIMVAVAGFYLFGRKGLIYTVKALIVSWFLSVLSSCLMEGFHIFPDAIRQAYLGETEISNYLELHDLVLAVGYIIVFYLCIRILYNGAKELKRFALFSMSMTVIISLLGMKRIVVLALIFIIILLLIAKRFSEEKRYKASIIACWAGAAVCFFFIVLLASGDVFYNMMETLGINPMGRQYYYKDIMKLAEFKITFPGIGRNVIASFLSGPLSYLKVGGTHSDILKMFVENGFILFVLWLWYFLVGVTKKIKEKFGYKDSFMYFILTVYTFILYLTDNIENYFICKILYIQLLLYFMMRKRKADDKIKQNIEEKKFIPEKIRSIIEKIRLKFEKS